MAFANNKTGEKAVFDYCPEDASSIMKMLIPNVTEHSRIRSLTLGDMMVKWRNHASTKYFNYFPEKYENFVPLIRKNGRWKGEHVNRFSNWVRKDFNPKHKTFDPLELMLLNGTNVRSTM